MSTIEVENLRVIIPASGADVVRDVSFTIEPGKILGLVGESGSGKSTVATALLGHARRGALISGGMIRVAGTDILTLSGQELERFRGQLIAYVPQDPGTALNPALRIGGQIAELLRYHRPELAKRDYAEIIRSCLQDVRLPPDPEFLTRFPHQLSGGQQQRVCIAMAFLLNPAFIVLDEPTTGLDVTTQSHVLETIKRLCSERSVSALYISHDLAVVGDIADEILVMYSGEVVELGGLDVVLRDPGHPYTKGLLAALPVIGEARRLRAIAGVAPGPRVNPAGCSFADRCALAVPSCRAAIPDLVTVAPSHHVRCIRVEDARGEIYTERLAGARLVTSDELLLELRDVSCGYAGKTIVRDVNLAVRQGECLALVGESGSGKTTLARAIGGLPVERDGEILFCGELLDKNPAKRTSDVRQGIQYIFQSPYASLNPRRTIGQTLRSHIAQHFAYESNDDIALRVTNVVQRVGLSPRVLDLYPGKLSGGERQRIAIARALGCEPRLLVCDEVTSALDVSVQAGVVNLLGDLQKDGLSLLFVTHNLALVRTMADRAAVMAGGRIVELGDVASVFESPRDPFTQKLMADTPGALRVDVLVEC